MSRPFTLEDFEHTVLPELGTGGTSESSVSDQELEERRLAAYEDGYSAGWNDAIASDRENQARVTETFARNLSDLSFTFHEARTHILGATEPIFREMVKTLFPQLMEAALCDNVLARLQTLVDNVASQPIELVVSPDCRHALETLVATHSGLDLKLIEEDTLGEGQVFLRFGNREERIDLTEVQDGFQEAIDAFFAEEAAQPLEEAKYG